MRGGGIVIISKRAVNSQCRAARDRERRNPEAAWREILHLRLENGNVFYRHLPAPGYDLIASPDRYPERGSPVPATEPEAVA